MQVLQVRLQLALVQQEPERLPVQEVPWRQEPVQVPVPVRQALLPVQEG